MLADFAGAGNTAAVRLMLDLGFDPAIARAEPEWVAGETALHVAVAHGCQSAVELLIERGAPLEAKRRGGGTPLRVAFVCLEQQSEWTPNEYTLPIAEALIRAGAKVADARLTLTAAVCLGRAADVERLAPGASAEEKQKALAAASYNARLDAIETALALGADPNAPNVGLHPDATALHNAVCSGSLDAVQKLVEAGARVDNKDGPYQATPLAWAEYFERESSAAQVEYFQREGSNPKQYTEIVAFLRGQKIPSA
jgi:ankyrin repeat protein